MSKTKVGGRRDHSNTPIYWGHFISSQLLFTLRLSGWSSFHPSLTVVHYGIPCYEMEAGDVCLPPGHRDAKHSGDSPVFDTFRRWDTNCFNLTKNKVINLKIGYVCVWITYVCASFSVMISLPWTSQRFTCWAAWPDSGGPHSPVGALFPQTETHYKVFWSFSVVIGIFIYRCVLFSRNIQKTLPQPIIFNRDHCIVVYFMYLALKAYIYLGICSLCCCCLASYHRDIWSQWDISWFN